MSENNAREKLINEITHLVMTSTDEDNLILSTFIAGMQAKGKHHLNANSKEMNKEPEKSSKQTA